MPQGQFDELTGALGRQALSRGLEKLTRELESSGYGHAVAMLDVDHLKTVNDVYGHAAGDTIIAAVVERARGALRSTDTIYRYGGDEFTILLPRTGNMEAAAIMRRVRDAIVSTPIEAGHRLSITVSIGVAASGEHEDDEASATMLLADERLYHAKRAGRNTLVSDDRDATHMAAGGFAETRLFGRDEQLMQVTRFLGSRPETASQRIMRVSGPEGAGHSRFLREAGTRASLTGLVVRRLAPEPAHRSLHLRALELAYSNEISADASVTAVGNRLRSDAEQHGLVILLENGQHLDPASRRLLDERLERTGTWLIEAVVDGETAALTAGTELRLDPLDRRQTVDWLGAATVGPIEVMTGNALYEASGGLPGRLARLTRALLERRELKQTPVGLSGDPESIRRRARQLAEEDGWTRVNLPQWDTPLVGRNRFLELIRPAARAARLVVLTGDGGVGKSRLASQLALELSPEARDGTDWLDLRAVTSVHQVPRLLATSLNLEPDDDLKSVAAQLRGQQRLLLVDEADGVADAAGIFSELLEAAAGLKLIVTSRMPLRLPEEVVIEVPELQEPAAQELFRQGMQRQRADSLPSDPEISALLEQIGFSPLSIELAAAWTRVFSVQELREALQEQPELLADAPGLQPRTQRFIEVTRQLMSAAEQETLGILALVPAGFTAEAAAQAAGASPFFLLALLERALLRREGNRYTVHAAIAERYRAGLREPDVARRRVVRAWSQLAARIEDMGMGRKTLHGYRIVDEEERNFRFVWRQALHDPDPELIWPLVQVLRGYMDVRGRSHEALRMFEEADAALTDSPDLELRGWVREARALFLSHTGRHDEALPVAQEAIALHEQHGRIREAACLAWNTAGCIYGAKRQDEEALAAFTRAAELYAQAGDRNGEAQALGNIAIVMSDLRQPEEALKYIDAAIERDRAINHLSGIAVMLVRKVQVMREHNLGTPTERLELALDALKLGEELGYRKSGALAGSEVAEALIELDRGHEAVPYLQQAAEWAQLADNPSLEEQMVRRASELNASLSQFQS